MGVYWSPSLQRTPYLSLLGVCRRGGECGGWDTVSVIHPSTRHSVIHPIQILYMAIPMGCILVTITPQECGGWGTLCVYHSPSISMVHSYT